MIQLSKMVKSYILIFIGFLCLLALPVNSLELAENIQFNKCSLIIKLATIEAALIDM